MKQTIDIISRLAKLVDQSHHSNNKLEAKNYVLQKRFENCPKAPIGFKSRTTSSYYLTTSK